MRNVKLCSQSPSRGFNGERLSTVAPFRSDTYSYETHVFCSLPQRRGHGRTQRFAGIAAGAASPHTRGGPGLLSRQGGSQPFEVGFASSPPSARRARRSTLRCRKEVRHHLSHHNSTFHKGYLQRVMYYGHWPLTHTHTWGCASPTVNLYTPSVPSQGPYE